MSKLREQLMSRFWTSLVLATAPIGLVACTPAPTPTQPQEISVTTSDKPPQIDTQPAPQAPEQLPAEELIDRTAAIETNRGTINIKLFPEDAPLAVSNFITLSRQGFYDSLTFHRVEPGFVVQGGDPRGNGTGGPGYEFRDEPVRRAYTRGIVAMANSGPNTNGSQFFIMLADTALPPQYTIFGEVTEGMDIVDQITVGDTMTTVTIQDPS